MLEWIFLAAFLWLQYEDYRTTEIGISMGKIELNPVISWIMTHAGKWWPVIKLPAIAAMIYAALHNAWLVILIANAIYTYVIWNNHKVISKA